MILPITTVDHVSIIRGDMIEGGAKMPALLRYLPSLNHKHFAYAGTVFGSGAWAVATACAHLGFDCSLFITKSDILPRWLPEIEKTGATLHWCDPLPVATLHEHITTMRPDLYNLPLGFDTPDFIKDMASLMQDILPTLPPELWVPALSGVLARSACLAFPQTPIHAVSPVKYPGDTGRSILHTSPEKFYRASLVPPPYPACPYSCAKVWQFAEQQALSGAYILNVGY